MDGEVVLDIPAVADPAVAVYKSQDVIKTIGVEAVTSSDATPAIDDPACLVEAGGVGPVIRC